MLQLKLKEINSQNLIIIINLTEKKLDKILKKKTGLSIQLY